MAATYTKLRDGNWGLRISGGPAIPGAIVTVAKKSGETKTETIGRVLWSGDGVTLATIAPASKTWDADAFNGYGAPRGRDVRACVTDGNCSSFGSGRSCGGHDCDGY